MLDETLLGVDVNRQWQQFDGDLVTIGGLDNVAQAVFNRLTCRYNDMSYFYLNYGSRIREFMGKVNYQQTLDSLAREVEQRVVEDPRVFGCSVDCTKINSHDIKLNIEVYVDDNNSFSMNFVLNSKSNTLAYTGGVNTFINLSLYKGGCHRNNQLRYEVRPNGTLRVLCRVTTGLGDGVPIGIVDFYWNTTFMKSVEVKKGIADFDYLVPSDVSLGEHTITAHYRGLGAFDSSKGQATVLVVDRLSTTSKFKYKYLYGVAGRKVNFPVIVKDYNGMDVTHGTVCYSLHVGGDWKLGTDLTISNMYKKYNDPKAVFQYSTLYDELGDPVPCGRVCYYINNGDGVLKATRNILSPSFGKETDVQTYFRGKVIDENNLKVPFGRYCWWLRKSSGIPMGTSVGLEDHTAYHGFKNKFSATLTDAEGYPVQDGIFCWYVKCIRECQPFTTKTEITQVDVRNIKTFINSTVKDNDDIPLDESNVCFSYDDVAVDMTDLPVQFTASNLNTNNLSPKGLQAMIVDKDGVVIDRGKFITTETEDGVVSTYISSDDVVEDEDTIELKLMEDKKDG